MLYAIENISVLRKLLWVDTLLGGITGIMGLCFYEPLIPILGLSKSFILIVSAITFCYAIVAGILAIQKQIYVKLLRLLIYANWIWTVISVGLLVTHYGNAFILGKIFLALQILAVGGLAYLEGWQLVRR